MYSFALFPSSLSAHGRWLLWNPWILILFVVIKDQLLQTQKKLFFPSPVDFSSVMMLINWVTYVRLIFFVIVNLWVKRRLSIFRLSNPNGELLYKNYKIFKMVRYIPLRLHSYSFIVCPHVCCSIFYYCLLFQSIVIPINFVFVT